ncbi:unnamed protein product [Bursaphelenchus xylophilus]|uniref:(pine wood nematode) hypothetical protein n=1 Tax=Bursaphelenchus xylophilus TaxID=6326 RepID=A0A1I7RKA1_BURXY|nr:unnamed protein product [Bursaphelenchus xylophilus]CAG9131405.1 unnamed protein product [Bursaphelenchus xylophilus]
MDPVFDYWSGVAAFSQTIATIAGVIMNLSLFVCLKLVPLGELKVFVPLIIVHSSIDLTHVFLNAIGVLRAVISNGHLYLILTGALSGASEPWFSVLLSSYFWTILLEAMICTISLFYRFLLVSQGFKPTVFLVGILTFLATLLAMMLGLVYFFALADYGTSDVEGSKASELMQQYPFWRRKAFDYAMVNTTESRVRVFFIVIIAVCLMCYLISTLFALRIRKDIHKKRSAGMQNTATIKVNHAADRLLRINICVPIIFYLIPVLCLFFYAALDLDRPNIGYVISIPYCWMPAAKAVGILLVMPSWRRAARRWLRGESDRSKRGINQRGQTVHPRISHIELSQTSTKEPSTRY